MIEQLVYPDWDRNVAGFAEANFKARTSLIHAQYGVIGSHAWQSAYSPNPYHNWRHATQVRDVAQHIFRGLVSNNLTSILITEELDIAALLHDVVHTGVCAGAYDDRANVSASIDMLPKLVTFRSVQREVGALIKCTAFDPVAKDFAPIDESLPPLHVEAQRALRDADMVAGYWHWLEWPILLRGLMVELGRDPEDEESCIEFLGEQLQFMSARQLFTQTARDVRDMYCDKLESILKDRQ